MIVGTVIGDLVAPQLHPRLEGEKLLWVEPRRLTPGVPGPPILAIDTVDAGMGETVLVVTEGRSAIQVAQHPDAPVNAAVVGVVDEIQWNPEENR